MREDCEGRIIFAKENLPALGHRIVTRMLWSCSQLQEQGGRVHSEAGCIFLHSSQSDIGLMFLEFDAILPLLLALSTDVIEESAAIQHRPCPSSNRFRPLD
jgi:hypothetical protein